MKFLHLADLHIGKKLYEYPLYEDLRFVLDQALDLAKKEDVDAIVIAGDVYDSGAPTAEAMAFYDGVLTEFHALGKPLIIVSGNHDSAERLGVGSGIFKKENIHIVTRVEDAVKPIEIEGVRFYPLPYFRPSDVNSVFHADHRTYEAAMKAMLDEMNVDSHFPNVLVTHQSILPLGAKIEASGSETALDVDANGSVGGTETIDLGLFDRFDYLALGHIHKAQFIGANARYSGAPLKYHVEEANAKRSFTLVDIQGKEVHVEERPLVLLRDLLIKQGTLGELLSAPVDEKNYVFVRLNDEATVDSPFNQLKARFPYLLGLDYAHRPTTPEEQVDFEDVEEVDKVTLFETFFEKYGGHKLENEEIEFVRRLMEEESK